jgi:2-methylisocitrate lyase-like PEP mutase family enzyme
VFDRLRRVETDFLGDGGEIDDDLVALLLDTVRAKGEVAVLPEGCTRDPENVLVGIPGMGTNVEEMRTLGVRRLSIGGSLTRAAWRTVLDGIAQMQNGQFTFTDHVASDRQITEPFD